MFKDGFCKNCYFENFYLGIYHPIKCTSHLNIEYKNLKYEKTIELQKHIIYISITGNTKVGITIKNNFYNRLMDQGAIKAIIIAITPNRYLSGKIEKISKNFISDRTNYINMLTNNFKKDINLIKIKKKIFKFILKYYTIYKNFLYKNNKIYKFYYPVLKYPTNKIYNFSFRNNLRLKEKLIGLKGQYLIFTNKKVLNIRNHIGYYLNLYIL
ncbi:MAG: DUF2797 domain-containing protein [Candidatus Shikimatogenerans sp. JK-2022]|nr:DUF2797 domain-containing protein [Candidatus Shikimatogenerans bostrichidophilus]